jgi:hypothetical protein
MRKLPFLAVALAALLVAPAPASATHASDPAVTRALDWLRTQQAGDGSIDAVDSSAWAAIAFARAGVDPGTVQQPGGASLRDYVLASTRPVDPAHLWQSLLALERQVLAIAAMGLDARSAAGFDAVQDIEATFDGLQLGDPRGLNDDIFGLQALHAAGVPNDDPVIQQVRLFVTLNQQPSGAWSFGSYVPPDAFNIGFAVLFADVDTTGQGTVAMLATGSSATDESILRAEAWVKLNQNLDGGCTWSPANLVLDVLDVALGGDPGRLLTSNADSTSWGMMGLQRAGQDVRGPLWTTPTGQNPVGFLLSLQQPDGHFLYRGGTESFVKASTTSWAALALEGHDLVS